MEAVRIENVSFAYPTNEHLVLQNVTTTIETGGFYLLMGSSGCGKSTLLRQLKKSLKPYGKFQGSITYKGIEIDELDDEIAACDIGFVMQNPADQLVTDTVWHELAFGLESMGLPNEVIKRRVAEMANFFGIDSWFRKDVRQLSGGQMQMVNLASVMAMQPEVLILDEPTSQLDPLAASDFLHTLQRINQEIGTTIIICEHRLEEVFAMCDEVIYMENGTILKQGTPVEVSCWIASHTEKLYEGLPAAFRIAAAVQRDERTNPGQDDMGERYPLTLRDGHAWLGHKLETVSNQVNEEVRKSKESSNDNSNGVFQKNRDYLKNVKQPTAIEMKDIYFRYEKHSHDVLRGCNLQVNAGEWFTLLGGNGAGKSTLLKVLTQSNQAYRGNITVLGDKKDYLGYKKMVMLPQEPKALFTEITVTEELMEALAYIELPYEKKVQRVEQMTQQMGLSDLKQHHPYDLSGGEQQRLGLGKLLLLEPQVLLLDEPTKGMDPEFKKTFAKMIHEYQKKGMTIFMVSHDVEFCAMYTDRCGMFFDGEVIAIEDAHSFFVGNTFYTTAANRMARSYFPEAVTCMEVIEEYNRLMEGGCNG